MFFFHRKSRFLVCVCDRLWNGFPVSRTIDFLQLNIVNSDLISFVAISPYIRSSEKQRMNYLQSIPLSTFILALFFRECERNRTKLVNYFSSSYTTNCPPLSPCLSLCCKYLIHDIVLYNLEYQFCCVWVKNGK